MNVTVTLKVYEVDGDDSVKACKDVHFSVASHWNIGRWVVLRIGDGPTVAVDAAELGEAAKKATR